MAHLGGCNWKDTDTIAAKVFRLLLKRLGATSRLFECAVAAYRESDSFADSAWRVEHLLKCFDRVNASQVEQLLAAFHANSQNHESFKGRGELHQLLEHWTEEDWVLKDNKLKPATAPSKRAHR